MIEQRALVTENVPQEKTVITSLSIDPELLGDAKAIARMLRLNLSAYVRDVLRQDIQWRTQGRSSRMR